LKENIYMKKTKKKQKFLRGYFKIKKKKKPYMD